ncbi:DUF930 domain-containing protein [Rhizobium sp. CB3090]|uniref:DUF930 domain-containing protein n=1 Tax=Rhizobium sp. CB3090 TaxID=3039156 RepID=UPI0024B268D0|nr:DUF930 domain-containing protein [Rhizobium sp. CB3090]WFU07682.1 DUF930 domain-containing protein [Rhizobium sp. CB3090]
MERVAEQRKQDERRWGLIPSILLHILLFAALFLLPVVAVPIPQPEDSINVEMVPQPKEQAQNAAKPEERSGRLPTPKPDEKPQQQMAEAKQPAEQAKSDTDVQIKGGAKADNAKPSADEANDKDGPKSEKQASVTEKPADPQSSSLKANPATDDPTSPPANSKEEEPSKEASSSSKEADAPTVKNATLSPKVKDSRSLEEATTSATADNNVSSAAEQAAENDTTLQRADSISPETDSDSQTQNLTSTAKAESEDKPNQSSAASSNSDPSDNTASMSRPELLATDSPSETKINQPDKPPPDQKAAGAQAETKAIPDGDTPKVAIPGITASQQPQAAQKDVPVNASEPGGTGLVVEPTPQQQQTSTMRPSRPVEEGQKTAVAGFRGVSAPAAPFIQAKQFYSAKELARLPKGFMAQWRELPVQMRMSQLCNAEGAAQLNAAGLHVLRFGLPSVSGSRNANRNIETDKAVYRTSDGYYYVGVKCGVDAAAMKVTSFAYRLGGSIPQDQWKSLNLPTN